MRKIVLIITLYLSFHSISFSQMKISTDDRLRITMPAKYVNLLPKSDYGKKKYYGDIPHIVLTGTYESLNEKSIRIKFKNTSHLFPVDSIMTLEKSLGTHGNFRKGAEIGFITGSFIGSIVYIGATGFNYGASIVVGCLLFGIPSSFVGGIFGSAIKTEHWEEVPLDRFNGGFNPPDRYYPIVRFQFPLRK